MKYMLLAYTNQAEWDAVDVTSPEFLAMCEFYENLERELTDTGELVMTQGLSDPSLAKTVRRVNGTPIASDGPYAETKEVLASFSIIECATHDRALAITARIVEAIGDTVELRPVMEGDPTEV
ncbi:YciI family protein [Rhodococcus sp. NPDC058505]|uniref:YciI family protein n=1 Tax=Rhodococcus sp. NPDC058505 TaxID=3346531 RepID=UPI00365478E9